MIRSELETLLGPEATAALIRHLRSRRPCLIGLSPDADGVVNRLDVFTLGESVRRRKPLTGRSLPA